MCICIMYNMYLTILTYIFITMLIIGTKKEMDGEEIIFLKFLESEEVSPGTTSHFLIFTYNVMYCTCIG